MVDRVEVSDCIIVFDGAVLIEYGPVYKTAVATEELLSNEITAAHYQVGAPDSMGKVIEIGQAMTYVDWLGEHAWFVYKDTPMSEDEAETRGVAPGSSYWALVDSKPTQEEAEAFALTLL